jgi:hypothetical protein
MVKIQATPDIWKAGAFDSDTLVDAQIPAWMKLHMNHYWTWQHERVDEGWRLVFRFADETDAMNFKLRWA